MKNSKLLSKSILVFLLLSALFSFAQTGIKVTYYTGTTQDYTVETSGKLYFSGSNLLIKTSTTANNVSIPTNIIRKITFTNTSLATQEIGQNTSKFKLYPNPASDFIKISSDKKDKINVKIYSVSGQIVHQGTYLPDENINVSNLRMGFYFVQANDTTFKMIKK
ncbi:T9SS type A sorting domain-containing protein [Chryseobacterium formosus]|uniref:T9SS type A sorting domain-containing protein n=1 Tax=Chryseobacterium formosus TaxID=1537363 RepID=A0ABT3XW17_9FLAO|nr:T9SS type A sorting domain-containing protein [Chryseobacterium formosus]MCX8525818.1 T9SS type A sorting domain-containing protein [Chryseobacterium formosus]